MSEATAIYSVKHKINSHTNTLSHNYPHTSIPHIKHPHTNTNTLTQAHLTQTLTTLPDCGRAGLATKAVVDGGGPSAQKTVKNLTPYAHRN